MIHSETNLQPGHEKCLLKFSRKITIESLEFILNPKKSCSLHSFMYVVSAKFIKFFVASDALQQSKIGPMPKKVGNHCAPLTAAYSQILMHRVLTKNLSRAF